LDFPIPFWVITFFEIDYSFYEAQTSKIPSKLQSGLYPQIHNSTYLVLTSLGFSSTNKTKILDMWTMFFDGSKTQDGARVGYVLINPSQEEMIISCHLELECTKNTTK
jgi:hypothetical protein